VYKDKYIPDKKKISIITAYHDFIMFIYLKRT